MEIRDLLKFCINSGVRLEESNGELRVHYDGRRPDAKLLSLLKKHKEELILLLSSRRDSGGSEPIPILAGELRDRVYASPAQRRMWLINRLEKESQYNMVGAFWLRGVVDVEALEASLNTVIARHEVLRSNYFEEDGELLQVVREPFDVVWKHVDISNQQAESQEKSLQDCLRIENRWRFNLELDQLVRATSIRYSPNLIVFILNVHHIVCDGWSIEILKREISAFYAAFVQRQSIDLALPRVQYADYSEWQRVNADRFSLDKQLRYWKTKLESLPQLHSLPLDLPRPPRQTYTGRQLHMAVPSDRLNSIKALCQANDVTLFMFLQTAFTAVLSLYSNERDVVMGFPVAGRRHGDAEATVGLFVNTIVLRCLVEGNRTFNEMLSENRRAILEALANQDVPLEQLIETLKPERSRAYNPLVQILFTLQNQVEGGFALHGLDVEKIANIEEPVKFDLQLVVAETGERLEVNWHYNADLFEEESIARMSDSLTRLIDVVTQGDEVELYSIFSDPNGGGDREVPADVMAYPCRRIEEIFEEQVRSSPERIAVSFEDANFTYRELDARANELASRLRMLGVRSNSLVGLCVDRSLEMVLGILGVLKAGAAYVPLDMSYPKQRLEAILSDCDPKILLTKKNFERYVRTFGRNILLLDDNDPCAEPSELFAESEVGDRNPSDPAYVIYTSGTTGTPKGVVVSHSGVSNLLGYIASIAPLTEPWNGSLWSSINFDVSVCEIFSPLCEGGTLHIVPDEVRLDQERLFRWMSDREIGSSFLYAGYLEPFGEFLSRGDDCHALKRMLVGVEPISSEHLNAIAARLPSLSILNGYGPTETTICCTIHRFEASRNAVNRRVSIGRAVAGMELHVMNMGGEPAPLGAVGELYVGGVGLAHGYLNKPELTRERFVNRRVGADIRRLYRTGDLVRYLPNGELEFIGRVDEQIKVRGFRIEPGEIEVRLCEQPEISDAVVSTIGEDIGKKIVAYIVPTQTDIANNDFATVKKFIDRIKRELKEFLPDYMLPSDIVLLERIPMTANGKVNRAALPMPSVESRGATSIKPPANAIECKLVEIWKEILELEEISSIDDFFALGGHSLHVARLSSRIRLHFQVHEADLSLEEIFENPTLETLAEVVDAAVQRKEARAKELYLASIGQSVEEGVF